MPVASWPKTELTTQVLIVGSGAAGLRAAIAAKDAGADVLIVTKGKMCRSGATFDNINGEWAYQAASGVPSKQDNPEKHFQEMVELGLGMINNELAWLVAQNAYDKLTDLQAYGVRFKKTEGELLRVVGCFSSVPRAYVTESLANLSESFYQVIDRRGIRFLEETEIIRLLVRDGRCVGALGVRNNNEFVIVSACATVLATGGGGGLFRRNLVPAGSTGDGYVLGFEAGAGLINMEFMQIMLGVAAPQENFFPLDSFKDNPRFLNCFNEEFLMRYYEDGATLRRAYALRPRHAPFSARDEAKNVDIGIAKEIITGKCTPRFAVTASKERDASGIVWPNGGVEVSYFFHSFNGGLLINFEAETGVKRLFAAGEAAGGIHGADRLGGNMMPATQVIGERAGKSAAVRCDEPPDSAAASELARQEIEQITSLEGDETVDFSETLDHLRWMMWKKCGVIRKADNLSSALRTITSLKETISELKTKNVIERLSVDRMLTLGSLVLRAALKRRETRGSHYREDFPEKDDSKFGRPLILHKDTMEGSYDENI
jgi:succinate dehydrogenase/fumarate reductase flavoprotein subunit